MDNAALARQYFESQGWSPIQAAAIVGNLMQESGAGLNVNALRPNDAGPGLHSQGLGQWNRDRLANLQAFAAQQNKPMNDFQTQLAFVQHELGSSEAGVAQRLRAAGNIDDATAAFIGYERPQGWTAQNPRGGHGYGQRLAYAQQVAGLPATPVSPSMGTSMGGYMDGPSQVAARNPAEGVQISAAGGPPEAAVAGGVGGAGGKGMGGSSNYERQMRQSLEKGATPMNEVNRQMAQTKNPAPGTMSMPNIPVPKMPSFGGGKSGA